MQLRALIERPAIARLENKFCDVAYTFFTSDSALANDCKKLCQQVE